MRFILGLCLLAAVGCGDEGGGSGGDESEKGTLPVPPLTQCKFHLQNLGAAMMEHQAVYGSLPTWTGSSFWVSFSMTTPPIISGSELAWYNCPVSPTLPAPGSCEYQGPVSDANLLQPGDVIGADTPGAHGIGQGGHVLLRNGQVIHCQETDLLWIIAQTYTSP